MSGPVLCAIKHKSHIHLKVISSRSVLWSTEIHVLSSDLFGGIEFY